MLNRAPAPLVGSSVANIDNGRASAQTRARFRALIQSPLRAGIIRFLHARPEDSFDLESLMATFGCLRIDVENCVKELAGAGIVEAGNGTKPSYRIVAPSDPDVNRLLQDFVADKQGESLEDRSPSVHRFREMIGRDEKMMMLFESIRTVAKTDLAVLIVGPTGSGKEIVARIIHELSGRQHQTFQAVNCSALPDSLFDSEVFGYERDAFAGAYERKAGRIELADHGTLFLDEVGELSALAQAKLLRVIDDSRVERLGSRTGIDVDFRLICASSRPVDALVADAAFREDLFYRINAFAIRLPALRERPADIPLLAERALSRYCAAHGLSPDARTLAPDAIDLLQAYPWPGNVRELETTISRAAMAARGAYVHAAELQFLQTLPTSGGSEPAALLPMKDVERDHIRKVLGALSWNKKRAAQILQISRETLYRKIAEYNLTRGGVRG